MPPIVRLPHGVPTRGPAIPGRAAGGARVTPSHTPSVRGSVGGPSGGAHGVIGPAEEPDSRRVAAPAHAVSDRSWPVRRPRQPGQGWARGLLLFVMLVVGQPALRAAPDPLPALAAEALRVATRALHRTAVEGAYAPFCAPDGSGRRGPAGPLGAGEVVVGPDGTAAVGLVAVEAYQLLGEAIYRTVALETATVLAQLQRETGGWAALETGAGYFRAARARSEPAGGRDATSDLRGAVTVDALHLLLAVADPMVLDVPPPAESLEAAGLATGATAAPTGEPSPTGTAGADRDRQAGEATAPPRAAATAGGALPDLASGAGTEPPREIREAAAFGLRAVLNAQLANGGWPRALPLPDDDGRFACLADGITPGLLTLLATQPGQLPAARRAGRLLLQSETPTGWPPVVIGETGAAPDEAGTTADQVATRPPTSAPDNAASPGPGIAAALETLAWATAEPVWGEPLRRGWAAQESPRRDREDEEAPGRLGLTLLRARLALAPALSRTERIRRTAARSPAVAEWVGTLDARGFWLDGGEVSVARYLTAATALLDYLRDYEPLPDFPGNDAARPPQHRR